MRTLQSQIEEVFNAAQECDEQERERVVADLCGDNHELRVEVESLLLASDRAQTFLETPPLLTTDQTPEPIVSVEKEAELGSKIGSYQILEEIGRGGMGVVYRGSRIDGEYDREVAIKLLRKDFGTPNWAERFSIEKQILANLNHPNVAQLIDGGTTAEGQSYLIMEYVHGEPVDEYCRQKNLSITERLLLFKKICAAVNMAHSNLIVHRDLKPDNIIVVETGEPKLLDFGIAKLMLPSVDLTTGITNAVPFTPEYAAPEQLNGGSITTATDIYSLGILLWELLSQNRPHHGINNVAELIRTITEKDIPDPSTRTTGSLRSALRGDLDAITRKAVNRQPIERYQSVNHLIADIDNFLNKRPVVASHRGAFYRLEKFLKRNALAVFVAGLFSIVLLAGSATSFWQWKIASSERDLSNQRHDELRKMVKALVFELPDRIASYPGSETVRADMTERGVALLDLLQEQEPQDSTLRLDLASAYFSMAKLQRGLGQANLGQTELAIENHKKSVQLLESILSSSDSSLRTDETRHLLSTNYSSLILLYYASNLQIASGIKYAHLCEESTSGWSQSASPLYVDARVSCLLNASFIKLYDNKIDEVVVYLDEAERLLEQHGKTLPRRFVHAGRVLEERAEIAARQGDIHMAIAFELKRLEIYKQMPLTQARHQMRLIAWVEQQLGRRHVAITEFEKADVYFNQSISGWRKIHEASPIDIPAIQNLAMVHNDKARLLWMMERQKNLAKQPSAACAHYKLSVEALNKLADPMAMFPTRIRGASTSREIHAEAATRCGI